MPAETQRDFRRDRLGARPGLGSRNAVDEKESARVRRVFRKRGACAARRGAPQVQNRAEKSSGRDQRQERGSPAGRRMDERPHGEDRRGGESSAPDAANDCTFGGECAAECAPCRIPVPLHADIIQYLKRSGARYCVDALFRV